MSALSASMRLDVRLQSRSRLYWIGLVVAVLLGLLVRFLVPAEAIGRGLAAFYILGLGGTTFMFGASMLLLERGERTIDALRVSTIRTRDYLWSKALTLTVFATVESLVVYAIAARGVQTNFILLFLGVLVLGLLYTWLGLGLAAPHTAVTTFLVPQGVVVSLVLQLPFLSLLGIGPPELWMLIPSMAPMLLLVGAFEALTPGQWVYAVFMSAASLAGTWGFATRQFRQHIRFVEN